MELIKIPPTTDIILQDHGEGKGKIIVSDNDWDYNFSHYWGAMGKGTSLREFLLQINSDYFAGKLTGHISGVFDVKKTFTNVRKHIREEMSDELPWYKHMEFQKDLREKINEWEEGCYSEESFVNGWYHFWEYTVDYYLVDNLFDKGSIKDMFMSIDEHWYFVARKEHESIPWLRKIHKKLKKEIKKSDGKKN